MGADKVFVSWVQLDGTSTGDKHTASSASWGPTALPQRVLIPHPAAPGLPGLRRALKFLLVPCTGTETYLL